MFREDDSLSPKFVLVHIKNLPMESAFVAEQRGGQQFRGWGYDRYMTATLINSIKILTYTLVMANVDPKKSKPKPPEPYPIPDDVRLEKPAPKPGSFAHTAVSLLSKAKKRKEGG